AGSLFDSLKGATVQAIYYTPRRKKETEKRIDPNGQHNEFRRGLPWLNTDLVKLAATLTGAAAGAGVWILIWQFLR
ncbi:MAG: DUF92 domain-containing protein, partial [Anaerolineae bacterium]